MQCCSKKQLKKQKCISFIANVTKFKTSASVKDWCMSPHGNAGPQNQSSPNSGNKFPLASPLTVQNFVTIRQEVSEISAIENLCSTKMWVKVQQNILGNATPQNPQPTQISSWSVKKCRRYSRSKIFTPRSKICAPRKSQRKFAKIFWRMLLNKPITVQNFWRLSKKCPRYPRSKVCPWKCRPKFTKCFRRCYSTKPLTNPNFVTIG